MGGATLPETLTDPDLYLRLEALAIGPAEAEVDFAHRLAVENGWSKAFAGEVIREYKRFVYLCCIQPRGQVGPMTPSDPVDQAWHLHLTYTRSYWKDLCGGILKRPLHHEPTRGGELEADRFHRQYEATLEGYAREFDEPPDPAIWPAADRRFRRARLARVDRMTNWVIAKRPLERGALAVGLGGVLAGLLAACALANPFAADFQITDLTEFEILILFVVIGIPLAILVQWQVLNRKPRQGRNWSGCGAGGCSGGDGGCGGGCGE